MKAVLVALPERDAFALTLFVGKVLEGWQCGVADLAHPVPAGDLYVVDMDAWLARHGRAQAAAELAALKERATAADMALLDEGATTCCYARSEKHWITDPQGVAWEHFHTLENIPVFNEAAAVPQGACCTPKATASPQATTQAACCGPSKSSSSHCC